MAIILDCTFRDGGYKTDWHFDHDQVQRHIAGTTADVVEIGYRADAATGHGPYRCCLDYQIDQLHIPAGKLLAVMVNANEWTPDLFGKKSRIDIVRVAAHLESLFASEAIARHLRRLGYFVTLNIMQAHRAPDSVFCREYAADVVYFADSFGCMSARQVARIVQMLKRYNHRIGFHGHNNTGRALSNTLAAMHAGAMWLDASVNGIGRGAGNADLEELLRHLGRKPGTGLAYLAQPQTLKSRIVYWCGAKMKMHPTRVEPWA